ncbi:hypothetical protein GCM10011412_08200 [Maribacter cobaltidurans]|nr:hypothetical protein GCM10011412_08200 [Maribacter cobaltidurans]
MVGPKGFSFENHKGEYGKDYQGYYLLEHLQLDKTKGSPVFFKANPIGRDLEHVFKQGNPPAN